MKIWRLVVSPVTNSSSFSHAIIRGVTRQQFTDILLAQIGLWPTIEGRETTADGNALEWGLTLQGDSETGEPLVALETLLKFLAAEYGFTAEFP